MNKPVSRVFLNPNWTVKEVYQRFPKLRLTFDSILRVDLKVDGDLSIREYFQRMPGPAWANETLFCRLNALAGAHYPLKQLKCDEWTLAQLLPRSGFFSKTPQPIKIDSDGAFVRENGLPCGSYWATHGRLGVSYGHKSGGIEKLTCWGWGIYPRAREIFFSGDVLIWGHGKVKNHFQKVRLWTYGFENTYGLKGENFSRLALEFKQLDLEVTGQGRVWVEFNLGTAIHLEGRLWKVLGWDKEHHCYGIYVGDLRNPAAGSPIHPPKMSIEESRVVGAGMDPYESAPDIPTCGNLYFVFSCGQERPVHLSEIAEFPKGVLHWSSEKKLRFKLAVGTTYQEAVANLNKARIASELLWLRRLEHARNISARVPRVSSREEPNLEAMVAGVSQQLNSLILEDGKPLKGLPERAYIDGWVNLEAMPALLHMGEDRQTDRCLDFFCDPRHSGPHGEVSPGWNYDWRPGIQGSLDQPADDAGLLILLGFHQWRCPNDHFTEGRYRKGKDLLEFMLEHADPGYGLLIDWGIGDGCAEDLGMKGFGYVAGNNSLWYVAVRTWEILAMEAGDLDLAERLHKTAEKIRQDFQRLFYDREGKFLCFAVYPKTLEKMRVFDIYNLWGWYFSFACELLDSIATRDIAETLYRYGFSHEWKTIRQQFPGTAPGCSPYPTVRQNISAANYYAFAGPLIRLARHRNGLSAMTEFLGFHYGKFLAFPEAFNMWPSIKDEEHASWGSWFIHNTAGAYQFIIEELFGIATGPGGVGLQPVGLDKEINLTNYRYGTSRWDFHLTGKGEWPQSVIIDGKKIVGSWCLPRDLSRGGFHQVEIIFGHKSPSKPLILETCGLGLEEPANVQNGLVKAILSGPGRAWVRYYSPGNPRVYVNGKKVHGNWSLISREGKVEVTVSGTLPVELKIEI